MTGPRILALALLVWAAVQSTAARQEPSDDRIVTTEHQMQLDGRALRYTARAGYLPIRDNETGEVHGRLFFIAYTLPRGAGGRARPLTFLWNGGPGSSSSLVHLIGFGPKRVGPGGAIIDNQGTWLGFSDLVFVDPIGTGYSRPVKAEYGPEFYQTRGDAESVAEFVRVYRNRFQAWESPVFLAGESYGVTRAAGVADRLEQTGTRVSGTMLIGLALPMGQLTAEERTALNVPTYTAAAYAHKKLSGAEVSTDLASTLRQAEAWAATRYAPALARRDTLPDDERHRVIEELTRWTGISASVVDRRTLAIPMPQFSETLLRDRNLIVGRYDSRMTAPFDPEQQRMYDPTKDPSLKDIIDDVAVVRYLRSALRFESDLPYQGPFGGGYPPATEFRGDWMSVRWNRSLTSASGGRGGTGGADQAQWLARAMTVNPALEVFSSCGYYDLVCSYHANEVAASRLESAVRARVQVKNYGGGHAMYTGDQVRLDMRRDVAAFVRRADRQAAPRTGPAPPAPVASAAPASPDRMRPDAVTTGHRIAIGGRTLTYTARAGLLPIRMNETGEPHGHIFYVAYTLDTPAATRRPLTFLWNGGPGANSALLHLTGFGPKRIKTSCECDVEDNADSWLEHSDLVFVDPVGTGFSRPTRTEYGAEFYNTLGDIASVAEFIRVYLTRFDAWEAPLVLAGESYGTWRASGVAEALEQRGQRVAGVVLISGGIQLGPVLDEDLRTALFIPTRAAAAFHHQALAPELMADRSSTLRQAETWARMDYAPALKRAATLAASEREAIAAELARFTGLAPRLIDRETLVVPRQFFAEQLLRDQGKTLARFDTRQVDGAAIRDTQRAAIVNRYLRETLRFDTDLAYQGVEAGFAASASGQRPPPVNARWNYNQAPAPPPAPAGAAAAPAGPPSTLARPATTDGPPGGAQPWLRRAMTLNPSLKAFVATGLYDSLNSCAAHAEIAATLDATLRRNLTAVCYDGGHMMYEDAVVRAKMTRDIRAFLAQRP